MSKKLQSKSSADKGKVSFIKRISYKVDDFQQRHKWLSFPYSVQKKYGDDEAGNEAALVTYYGFLSLFPLLVVALSVTQLVNNPTFKTKVITSLNKNFPIVGSELQNNVHASQKAGIALVLSIILTLYGARGVASAFQRAMNHIWQVPKYKRGGFKDNLKSLLIVIVLGITLLITGTLSSYATAASTSGGLRIVAIIISLFITFIAVIQVFKISIAENRNYRELYAGSIIAAIGIQLVQAVGGFLITHELKKLSSLYGTFAIIFALLFWIYLQVRIVLYATEVDTVRCLKLWPRSFTDKGLTKADKRALRMYVGRERYKAPPEEDLDVRFEKVKQK